MEMMVTFTHDFTLEEKIPSLRKT